MLTAVARAPEPPESFAPPLMYLTALAVIERGAFDPTLFTLPGQQPLALRGPYRELGDALTVLLAEAPVPLRAWRTPPLPLLLDGDGRALLAGFDYLVLLYPEGPANPDPGALTALHRARLFHLYRVDAAPPRLARDGRAP